MLGYSQDIDVILGAAALLRDEPDILLLLVGYGPKRAGAEALARAEMLTNVRFVDPVPPEQFTEVLRASDVGLATLVAEVKSPVVPSKILGFMAVGLPTILAADPAGDAPALIRRADAGVALAAGDAHALATAVRRYYADRNLTAETGRKARAYAVEHFSVSACARRYEELAASLLATRPRPGRPDA